MTDINDPLAAEIAGTTDGVEPELGGYTVGWERFDAEMDPAPLFAGTTDGVELAEPTGLDVVDDLLERLTESERITLGAAKLLIEMGFPPEVALVFIMDTDPGLAEKFITIAGGLSDSQIADLDAFNEESREARGR